LALIGLDLESSFLVYSNRYVFTMVRPSSYVKVRRSRSQEQKVFEGRNLKQVTSASRWPT